MDSENYILITHYCEQTKTPIDFIEDLLEYGMIEVQQLENKKYVQSQYIIEIERIYRLHHDLGINMEGIESLNYMLERINLLEQELKIAKNRLAIYEH